jgi:uncharacterized membrane protein
MAVGPVQLLVLGFTEPEFEGEISRELEKLRQSDTVRVIDALAVHKDAEGAIEVQHLSNLTAAEAAELGSTVAALVGLAPAEIAAEDTAAHGIEILGEELESDVIEEIPNDSAAVLILLEHQWAVGLRDAIARVGGYRIADGMISAYDLVAIGLASKTEAPRVQEPESKGP